MQKFDNGCDVILMFKMQCNIGFHGVSVLKSKSAVCYQPQASSDVVHVFKIPGNPRGGGVT